MEAMSHNFTTATTEGMGQVLGARSSLPGVVPRQQVVCIEIPVKKSSSYVVESVNSSSGATVEMIREVCTARRMGESHNGAYIERPVENCPHGKILLCSHIQCRTGGRRFRWCAVCRKATAARNFVRRHSHVEILNGAPIEALTKNKVLDKVDKVVQSVVGRVVPEAIVPRVDGAEILRKAGITEVSVGSFREGEARDTQSPQKAVAEGARYEDKKRKAEARGATAQSFRRDFLQQGYQDEGSATGKVSDVNVLATQNPQDINDGLLESIRSRKRSLYTDDSVTEELLARRVKDAMSKRDTSAGINHGSTMDVPADVSNPSRCNTPQIPQESMDERRRLLLSHIQQLRVMMEKQSASSRSSTATADVPSTTVDDPIDTTVASSTNILQLREMIEQQGASTRCITESSAAEVVVPNIPVNEPIDTTVTSSTKILPVHAIMEQQDASTRSINKSSAAPAVVPDPPFNDTINSTATLSTNHKVMVLTEREANLIELLRAQSNKSSVDYWVSQILLASDPPGVVPKQGTTPSGQQENSVRGQAQQFVQSFF